MSIAEAVQRASTYLTEHPEEARYRDSAARAHLSSGLVVDVTGPTGESLRTDMPTGIGGTASAPSPGWFLRAAEASCIAALVAIRAAAEGIVLRSVDVEVDSESDDRGILGLGEDDIPAGALSVQVVISIDAPTASRGEIDALAAWAVDHCPVMDSVKRAVPINVDVR
jgi:uncharacterized OsmC-like protein